MRSFYVTWRNIKGGSANAEHGRNVNTGHGLHGFDLRQARPLAVDGSIVVSIERGLPADESWLVFARVQLQAHLDSSASRLRRAEQEHSSDLHSKLRQLEEEQKR